MAVRPGSPTQYIEALSNLPNGTTPTGWTALNYDTLGDSGKGDTGNGDHTGNWQSGILGVGVADGDDATRIDPDGSVYSVYTRTSFTVSDVSEVLSMTLEMDYDDAYVVWLNGVEVSRSAGLPATPVWNSLSSVSHEAAFRFTSLLSLDSFINVLQNGTNVLAIGVWNNTAGSSDLSIRPRLLLYDTPYVPQPLHTYLTWQGDTGTTMTVNYHTGATAGQSKVYYDVVSHGGDLSQ
ncbi:MAG: fibronectin type III domain-containing protein [Candidatus Hydrogenedentes bacterium]|nr:fibronectin type III domain-containing protein [Candidatus Hydrogenedentota bacterium]